MNLKSKLIIISSSYLILTIAFSLFIELENSSGQVLFGNIVYIAFTLILGPLCWLGIRGGMFVFIVCSIVSIIFILMPIYIRHSLSYLGLIIGLLIWGLSGYLMLIQTA